MKREINRWYSWPGYDAYKWKSIDELKEILGLTAKSVVNIQLVDDDGILREVRNREVGKHVWLQPCLFQVAYIYVEPTSIWVNEYNPPAIAYSAHASRKSAETEASGLTKFVKRIAVEYVEKR